MVNVPILSYPHPTKDMEKEPMDSVEKDIDVKEIVDDSSLADEKLEVTSKGPEEVISPLVYQLVETPKWIKIDMMVQLGNGEPLTFDCSKKRCRMVMKRLAKKELRMKYTKL